MSEADQQRPSPSGLLGVMPTELRSEWNRRTRYGKGWFLLFMPVYVLVWAVIISMFVTVAFVAMTVYRGFRYLYGLRDRWPSVYEGGHDA